MKIRELLPVLAGLVSLVVVASFLLGGYGLILSCCVVAGILSGSQDHDSQTDSRNA